MNNILVLTPGARLLDFALYVGDERTPSRSGRIADYRGVEASRSALKQLLTICRRGLPVKSRPQAWAVRIPFGGELFTGPVLLEAESISALETLVPQSPLILPAILALLRALQEIHADQPVALVFESAFFAQLPQREASYALSAELIEAGAMRRWGMHGLYHGAACARARQLRKDRGLAGVPRILSICLDAQPELAAVIRDRPVMVTGGVTPLEGLPGQTTCGELDPGIIITLSDTLKWGPERIDRVLTRESGWCGLTGERTELDALLTSERYAGSPCFARNPCGLPRAGMASLASQGFTTMPRGLTRGVSLGRAVMNYRLLLACGAGIAALGGVNQIVFSGRYAELGETLGPSLITRLRMGRRAPAGEIQWDCFPNSLDRIIADQARLALPALPAGRALRDGSVQAQARRSA